MKRKTTYIGLMLGAVMMIATTGAVFGADQTIKTGAVSVSTISKDQGNNKATANTKADGKKLSQFYGKVNRVKKNELVLESASVVWEKAGEKDLKKSDKNAKKEADSKDGNAVKTKNGADVSADLETPAMKWKLDGKKIKIKTDKDTKYGKESNATSDKNGKETDVSNDKTDKKKTEKVSSAGTAGTQSTVVRPEDIKEGMLLKVTIKADGSMTAKEVLVVDGVKESKPAKATKK